MNAIFIVGFTGVGKTTVGKALAEKLELSFIDTDHFLEWRYHSTVTNMFETCGVEKFRKREKVALIELSQKKDTVISTGGGMATYDDNMELMLQRGTVIYLQAPPEVLAKRLFDVRDTRPAVAGKELSGVQAYVDNLLPKRAPIYEKATFTIDATHLESEEEVSKVVEEIVKLLELH